MERRNRHPSGLHRSGFTLAELLIVLAILSILAALLFPIFAASSEKARQAACASNLRQIGTAFQEYADDDDGVFCSLRQPTLRYCPDSLIWSGMLAPYLDGTGVFFCPSSAHPLIAEAGGAAFDALGDTPVNDAQLSLGMNAGLDPAGEYGCFVAQAEHGPDSARTRAVCTRPLSDAAFARPAQSAAFADSVPSDPHPDAPYLSNYTDPVLGNLGFLVDPALIPTDTSGGLSDRHGGGTNVAFLDGHVRRCAPHALVADPDYVDFLRDSRCQNYDAARVLWDPSAADPERSASCP